MVQELTSAVQGATAGASIGGPVGAGIGGLIGFAQGLAGSKKDRQAFRLRRADIRAQNQNIREQARAIGRNAAREQATQRAQIGAAGVTGASLAGVQTDLLRQRALDRAAVLSGVDTAGANARSPKSLGQKAGSELKRASKRLRKLF